MIVEIEDPLTWPDPLCELLAASKDLLCRFEQRQSEIDQVPGRRFSAPPNEFAEERRSVIERGDRMLAGERILGFHCTRLLPHEAESVRKDGFRLPSPKLLRERIEKAVSGGYLCRGHADALLANNQAADANRQGRIAFANARSALRQRDMVGRFFDSWGGEALYNSHEDNPTTGPVLKRMGQPCIVVVGVHVDALCVPGKLAGYFANAFLRSSGVRTRNEPEFESWVERLVPPDWLVKVVVSPDPRFFVLTALPG